MAAKNHLCFFISGKEAKRNALASCLTSAVVFRLQISPLCCCLSSRVLLCRCWVISNDRDSRPLSLSLAIFVRQWCNYLPIHLFISSRSGLPLPFVSARPFYCLPSRLPDSIPSVLISHAASAAMSSPTWSLHLYLLHNQLDDYFCRIIGHFAVLIHSRSNRGLSILLSHFQTVINVKIKISHISVQSFSEIFPLNTFIVNNLSVWW